MSDFGAQFSEHQFTPKQAQLLAIQDHMRRTIDDFALLFAQTWHGFALLRDHLESNRQSLLAQLSQMFSPDEAERQYNIVSQLLVSYHVAADAPLAPAQGTLASFHADATPNSRHLLILTSSLLIALNQYWEHTWRPGITKIAGGTVNSDFWGEVCKIRDCILHNKARVDKDYERRAKVLKWFKNGENIEITDSMFVSFVSEARAYCESFILEFW